MFGNGYCLPLVYKNFSFLKHLSNVSLCTCVGYLCFVRDKRNSVLVWFYSTYGERQVELSNRKLLWICDVILAIISLKLIVKTEREDGTTNM